MIAEAPEDQRASLRQRAARPMLVASAALGDTATARTWRAVAGTDSLLALEAAAVAAAGDRQRAARLFERAARDTASDADNLFALGVTAEAIGRPVDALDYYNQLDSLYVEPGSSASTDWLLFVRALARRGGVAAQLGDYGTGTQELRRVPDAVEPSRCGSCARSAMRWRGGGPSSTSRDGSRTR